MNASQLTLGDLVNTGGNAAVDVLIDKLLGKKPQPQTILVESDGVFQWARPVVTADDGKTVPAPQMG